MSITGINVSIVYLNPFHYKGYYDTESGMYYCKSRYYVPDWGRWLNYDSANYIDWQNPLGINAFSYCNNNPINYYDPSGHSALLIGLIIGAIIGACVGFGAAAYIDYKDDGEVFNGSVKWYDYLFATMFGANIGGAIGAGLGVFAGTSFSISIPMLGISAFGGAAAISVAGTVAVTVTGAQILTGAAAIGGTLVMYSYKRKNAAPRIKCGSKKEAYQKAFKKGGKIKPRLDFDCKHGPHYHPAGNKFSHWHYYFPKCIIAFLIDLFFEEEEEL